MSITMDRTIFHPRSFKLVDLNEAIRQFVLCGTPVDPSTESSILHWKIYLVLDGEKSVLFDLTPGGGADGMTGTLIVDSEPYPSRDSAASSDTSITGSSSSRTDYFPISPSKSVIFTGAQVLETLRDSRRDKYRYDSTGSGCRFWCTTVVGDLERASFIPQGSLAAFENYIVEKNEENPGRYPLPTRKGTFY
ncbi:hypothetical protein SCHPADRAFT_299208 [Schizopora paradoxa]|uniref:DUF7770 domain-containing protein n=1 Tax=Schizopora paradoxa TaxID=27342 RepID=A0A0H2RSE0_9AGAM|nr:hypothetical protein SCHPADRAFT_299208 [Schizopora paradoxa]